MTFQPIKTTSKIHSTSKEHLLHSNNFGDYYPVPFTLSGWDIIRVILYCISSHSSAHKSCVKPMQKWKSSMEKAASHLHILRLQGSRGTWAHKSILQSLCTEVGTFNSIFECSQLTRIIIGFSVTGHLCHIIVD